MSLFRKNTVRRMPPPTRSPNPDRNRRQYAALAMLVGLGALVVGVAAAKAAAGPGHPAVVAKTTIPAGTTITSAMVTTHDVNGVVHTFKTPALVIGKQALGIIPAGSPLVAGLVGQAAHQGGLTTNEVGVWVPVNLTTSALATSGDRVDVIFTSSQLASSTQGAGQAAGVVLLQGAQVLAVANSTGAALNPTGGKASSTSSTAPAAVELAVPRREAPQLVEAETLGTLTLVQDPWVRGVTIPRQTLSPPTPPPSGTAASSSSTKTSPAAPSA